MAVYSAGSPLVWRESGRLPSPRYGLRATVVGEILYVSGGYFYNGNWNYFTSVLSWNPAGETWQEVGNLAVGRYDHAAVAVPTSVVAC